jgi:phospholipid-binding lipoprotein MlaA
MRARRLLPGLLVVALLPACATLPAGAKPDPGDRFERFNRSVYAFNDTLDRHIARPVAKAYVRATPTPVRAGVHNFFNNLFYTKVMLNDLLQGKGRQFLADTTRLVVNTTVGIGGLFDPAGQLGLSAHDEDFGQTLGKWGMPPGPFLMLPVLGPSTVRDTFGLVADQFSEPDTYLVHDWRLEAGITLGSLLDRRATLLGTDQLLDSSYDPYAFVRNAYLQRRRFQITDGAVSTGDDMEIYDEPTDDDAPAPDSNGQPESSTAGAGKSGEQRSPAGSVDIPAAQNDADAPAAQTSPQ